MVENERFVDAINWLKQQRLVFNNADLSVILDVSQTYVSLLKSGKKPITENLVKNLVTKFPSVNGDWILTGEGTMLKVDATADHFEGTEGDAMLSELKKGIDELQKEIDKLKVELSNRDKTINVLTKALENVQDAEKTVK